MSRFAIRPVVASLALAVAAGTFAGAASAAPDASTSAAQPSTAQSGASHSGKSADGRRFHHMQGMRDALWVPGVGPLGKKEVAALKLDANQQALFSAAQQAQQDFGKSMREGMATRHQTLDQQLQAGKLDPHALADAQAQARQQYQGRADEVRQKWLAVWDSLNDGQRQQVTQFVKDRQARMQERREEHRKDGRPGAERRPAPAAPATSS
ncbi:hypothetical protein CAL26_15750 [Bordetella genomosp. 9]|uniref:LTXXQ motif family protein n=1 Tax=Bordetella genomosp. 9 TaxID=1416803 RepID=A0A261R279_9BORD|nr:hypothetical protein [Bordetella genomosp. 9]OZI19109.1 hypothetical protein CAL26_15750 [Bordetella genomosp. 9]